MARTRGALHDLVDLSEVELPRVGFGVYLLDRRHQHQVGARFFQEPRIGFGSAGVAPQVVLVVELRGVDEYAHRHRVVFAAGTFHQRTVPGMQGAHRRDEPDSRLLQAIQFGAELLDACQYFHLFRNELRGKGMKSSDKTKQKREKSAQTVPTGAKTGTSGRTISGF